MAMAMAMPKASKSTSRYTDVVDEPINNLLVPIKGYQDKPIVSLMEAIEPVAGFFNEIEDNVLVALHNSQHPADGLSQQESASIHLYTMEFDGGPSLYALLNQSLRAEIREELKPWFLYLKLFLTGLYKLPSQKRRVWRGIRGVNLSPKYKVGMKFAWWGVSSCTTDMKLLESEKFLGKVGERTLFSIECINGKSIVAHSYFKSVEQEIVLLPGSYFEVLGILNPAPHLHIIELKEIVPPMTLVKPPFSKSNEGKAVPTEQKATAILPKTKLLLESEPHTELLSRDSEEFKKVYQLFLNGWPHTLRGEIIVEQIYKIHNDLLETRFQQFVSSNSKFAFEDRIGWHGTSSKCQDGSCMSSTCQLCQIIRYGFRRQCARRNTISYKCWGPAIYFANKSFVCHTYNGSSSCDTNQRCTIMTKVNAGHTVNYEQIAEFCIPDPSNYIPALVKKFKYDSVVLSRNYYIAPTDYILLYNDLAALPMYMFVYSVRKAIQVRRYGGDYCYFHQEYHMVHGNCDGHQCQSLECTNTICLDQDHHHFVEFDNLEPNKYITSTRKDSYESILNTLGPTVYP